MVDPIVEAVEYCNSVGQEYPEQNDFYQTVATYVQEKLWHQLTNTILQYIQSNIPTGTAAPAATVSTQSIIDLYNNIIVKFYTKLHPLTTSRVAVQVTNHIIVDAVRTKSSNTDIDTASTTAREVLTSLLQLYEEEIQKNAAMENETYRKKKENTIYFTEAIIYLQSKRNLITLYGIQHHPTATSGASSLDSPELLSIKNDIKKNADILLGWNTITSKSVSSNTIITNSVIVQAAHYEQSMTYYKIVGPPEAFYEQAMQFVTVSPPPEGTTTTTTATSLVGTGLVAVNYHQLAIDLCLAALTGDGVYNLGQLEQQTPVLQLLGQPPSEYYWLVELVQAVSYGKVLEFQALTQKYATQIQQQPALLSRATAVEEKLALMALTEYIVTVEAVQDATANEMDVENPVAASTTRGGGTIVTFEQIATALHRPVDQIEYVIIRACSVGLIKASMDQVDGTVHVSWVTPRILNATQMLGLASKFATWSTKVSTMEQFMKDNTQTLFA